MNWLFYATIEAVFSDCLCFFLQLVCKTSGQPQAVDKPIFTQYNSMACMAYSKDTFVPSIPVSWLCENLCGTASACIYYFTISSHLELLLCLCFGGLLGKCQWCSQTEGHNVNLNCFSNNSRHVTTVQAYSTSKQPQVISRVLCLSCTQLCCVYWFSHCNKHPQLRSIKGAWQS